MTQLVPNTVEVGFVVRAVVADDNPKRFEAFCCDLATLVEGDIVLPTSVTHDRGRDGRTAFGTFLAASLRDDVDKKASQDVTRLKKTTPELTRLYFCSSQELSETACDKIETKLRAMLPDVSVVVLGAAQLGELCKYHVAPAAKHYHAELANYRHSLANDSFAIDPEHDALRLALCTKNHPDSHSLRAAVMKRVLLRALSSTPQASTMLAKLVADGLRLSKSLSTVSLSTDLGELQREGLCDGNGSGWTITDAGRAAIARDTAVAATAAQEGASTLRAEIEYRIDDRLSDQHAAAIWLSVKNAVAHAFYVRGLEVVRHVRQHLGQDVEDKDPSQAERHSVVDSIAGAVATTSAHDGQREELRAAVLDMFAERTGPAFKWLAATCAAFVAVCSLGIEQVSGEQLRRSMARTTLILDTDVLLSLLCIGEVDHQATKEVWTAWRALGGRCAVTESIVHEVAHHAWIAQKDFNETRKWLPGTVDDGLRLVSNSFVRAFAVLVRTGQARLSDFGTFMADFRGKDQDDTSAVILTSAGEYGLGMLAAAPQSMGDYANRVAIAIAETHSRHGDWDAQQRKIEQDKARRDGLVFSAVVHARTGAQELLETRSFCVVTSSARMRAADEAFLAENGAPITMSLATASCMLSLVPGQSVSLPALERLLFDGRLSSDVDGIERIALRVIKESGRYDVTWAKRRSLMRQLDSAIQDRARDLGVPIATVHREFSSPAEGSEAAASMISKALDRVGAKTTAEREVERLQNENDELRRRLQQRG